MPLMPDWLSAAAQARPEGAALVADGETWTFARLNAAAAALAQQLSAFGVVAGERIGVLLTNQPDYVLLIHALARLHCVLVPLNVRLTARELRFQVEQAKCAFVIVDEQMAERADALTAIGCLIVNLAREQPALPGKVTDRIPAPPPAYIETDNVCAMVFTSGTSGTPKAAMLTYGNFYASAWGSAARIGVLPRDRWLVCLPLYHVGGLSIILRSALYNTGVVLHNGFDAERVWRSMENDRVSLISLVPTMLYRLLDARPGVPFPSSLRLVLLGGAAAGRDLLERCNTLGVPVATTYGLTEAASQVATMLPEDAYYKPGSVGKPLPFTTVRVVRPDGQDAAVGEHGEIVVTSATVTRGYFEQPSERVRDGTLWTGDLGYLDAEGDLWIVQRRSDLIVTGGENVYPAEVEAALREHPDIADVCVVGVPSPEWGQQVAAAVVLKENVSLNADALMSFARQLLAGYKVPRLVRFVRALPQTSSGKIARAEIMAWFGDNSSW